MFHNKTLSNIGNDETQAQAQDIETATKMVDSAILERCDKIVKPSEDKREYLGLKLKNSLQILLISDPETDIAASSLSVHVGSMSDPPDCLGLAHFLEHMLFMGTQKVSFIFCVFHILPLCFSILWRMSMTSISLNTVAARMQSPMIMLQHSSLKWLQNFSMVPSIGLAQPDAARN